LTVEITETRAKEISPVFFVFCLSAKRISQIFRHYNQFCFEYLPIHPNSCGIGVSFAVDACCFNDNQVRSISDEST
jgi:hypothetical protein